ncbi:MAG TPA: hypothetical protein PKY77_15335 [Phycisphaerae bacterium]|nr:hypothetical protein [Phycisphaerae bacterium]HRY70202.1 hypothetical protein [Phycisphaerae bacterium]HSA27417.1 hypothetical protein [Phycisphaerae bacterium]
MRALSATSRVVGQDPYELRIAGITDGGQAWEPVAATISAGDQTAGVSVSLEKATGLVRVTIQSPTSRSVRWNVKFEGKPLPT